MVAVSVREKSGTRRGSGVCVRRPNEILTSDRLVGSSTAVEVTTSDGVVHRARILGRDSTTDLVLLTLDGGVPIAAPAVHAPRTGDTVWVVGAPSPGDPALWMSSGMVASTDSLVSLRTGPTTSGLLETAAVSSTTASGGALVDSAGNVTGIILSPVGNGPHDLRGARSRPRSSVADELRIHGHTTHGALGINGIDAPAGPTVTAVVAGGPAATRGHARRRRARASRRARRRLDGRRHGASSVTTLPASRSWWTSGAGSRSLALSPTLAGMVPR